MSDDTKADTPDPQDALWTEHEPDTERVGTNGDPVDPAPEAYVAPRLPDVPSASLADTPDDERTSEVTPLGTAVSHDPASSQYIAVGPDPVTSPKRRIWLVWVVVVGVLGILSAGVALAYNLWYQNPDKVLSDAVMHAVEAKSLTYNGAYATDSNGAKLTLDFDGNNPSMTSGQANVRASLMMSGQTFKLNGSGLVDKDGTIYFKLSNVRSIVDSFAKQRGIPTTSFNGLVAKVDDKWVKVTTDDVKQANPSASKNQACFIAAFEKLDSDRAEQKELTDLYRKYKFITVDKKLGSATFAGQQSLGYALRADAPSFKKFVNGLNDTSLATALKACDKTFAFRSDMITDEVISTKTAGSMHVWVSRWTHDFTHVAVDGADADGQKTSFWVEPQFNKAAPIATPTSALTIKQLQAELQDAFSGMMSARDMSTSASRAMADAQYVQKQVELYNAETGVYPSLAQLKAGTRAGAKLSNDINSRVGSSAPSAADPAAIQYQLCAKGTGGSIGYFDVSTNTVMHLTAGICTP